MPRSTEARIGAPATEGSSPAVTWSGAAVVAGAGAAVAAGAGGAAPAGAGAAGPRDGEQAARASRASAVQIVTLPRPCARLHRLIAHLPGAGDHPAPGARYETFPLLPGRLVGPQHPERIVDVLVVDELIDRHDVLEQAGLHAPLHLVLDPPPIDAPVRVEPAPLAVLEVAAVRQLDVLRHDVDDLLAVDPVALGVVVIAQRLDVGDHESLRRLGLLLHELRGVVDHTALQAGGHVVEERRNHHRQAALLGRTHCR